MIILNGNVQVSLTEMQGRNEGLQSIVFIKRFCRLNCVTKDCGRNSTVKVTLPLAAIKGVSDDITLMSTRSRVEILHHKNAIW